MASGNIARIPNFMSVCLGRSFCMSCFCQNFVSTRNERLFCIMMYYYSFVSLSLAFLHSACTLPEKGRGQTEQHGEEQQLKNAINNIRIPVARGNL